jgi:hypothetical protein
MLCIEDKELILIQNSSTLGRMEDNPIYLIIIDSSKRERGKDGFYGLEKIFLIVTSHQSNKGNHSLN